MPRLVECPLAADCVACGRSTPLRDERVHAHVCSEACATAIGDLLDWAAEDPGAYEWQPESVALRPLK